jgi:hypothetical protein
MVEKEVGVRIQRETSLPPEEFSHTRDRVASENFIRKCIYKINRNLDNQVPVLFSAGVTSRNRLIMLFT